MRWHGAMLLLLWCGSALAQEAAAEVPAEEAGEGEWVEHFDKKSGKNFYYNSVSRKTAWEAPPGATVKYMNAAERGEGGEGGEAASGGSGNGGIVMLALSLTFGLPFLGLLFCYYAASKEGLSDVLKQLKARRNRAAKRRVRPAVSEPSGHTKPGAHLCPPLCVGRAQRRAVTFDNVRRRRRTARAVARPTRETGGACRALPLRHWHRLLVLARCSR